MSLDSHQTNLANLIDRAIDSLPVLSSQEHTTATAKSNQPPQSLLRRSASGSSRLHKIPDFVSVTRGPGMRSNLSTGLDTAKGLATAWQIPLIGVNHMQAHALTPRLISALDGRSITPAFPFFSLLISGGHTLLVHSKGLTNHSILASTSDIAIGDCIDKVARATLPATLISASASKTQQSMYGPLLETFAFPNGAADHGYTPPARRQEELERRATPWGWGLGMPLAETRSGKKVNSMEFSFSGLESSVGRIVGGKAAKAQATRAAVDMGTLERVALAREAMRVAFEHLASRVVMALQRGGPEVKDNVNTLVVSGGVASNKFLRVV